ncbi:MAG: hypothetical protein Q7S27_04885 [Nanoarchaeota archaeon]|nr:hypothetical protein [Nanoarchaeota archaeon]
MHNRNKLIDILISNISNAVVHRILEKATLNPEIVDWYRKEMINSFQIAKKYRDMINPKEKLPEKNIAYIRDKILRKVKGELLIRVNKGYENIDLDKVEEEIDQVLEEMKVI